MNGVKEADPHGERPNGAAGPVPGSGGPQSEMSREQKEGYSQHTPTRRPPAPGWPSAPPAPPDPHPSSSGGKKRLCAQPQGSRPAAVSSHAFGHLFAEIGAARARVVADARGLHLAVTLGAHLDGRGAPARGALRRSHGGPRAGLTLLLLPRRVLLVMAARLLIIHVALQLGLAPVRLVSPGRRAGLVSHEVGGVYPLLALLFVL